MSRTRFVAWLLGFAWAALLLFVPRAAFAHKASDAYLSITTNGPRADLALRIAVRDLDDALGLDEDADGAVTGRELEHAMPRVLAYAGAGIKITRGGTCALDAGAYEGVVDYTDGTYAALGFRVECPSEGAVTVDYSLLFEIDPLHRCVVRKGAAPVQLVTASIRSLTFASDDTSASHGLRAMLFEGIRHIWTGYDHVLFLVALLLPAVLRRTQVGTWEPQAKVRSVLVDVTRVVTAFTLAHSITLSLAALGVVALPSRFVESAIALSVVAAAANNVRPVLGADRWLAAFVLGLLHGFGFSGTLSELGLPRAQLLVPLLGFNGGVEIGQMAIVAVLVPALFAMRKSQLYARVLLRGGSAVIAVLALVWLVERLFDLKLIS
jgi:hypothetical protein